MCVQFLVYRSSHCTGLLGFAVGFDCVLDEYSKEEAATLANECKLH